MQEKVTKKLNEKITKYINLPRLQSDSERSFINIVKINLAYVLMLKKQGIIDENEAKVLIKALIELENEGPNAIGINPNYEDYYFDLERYIIARVGINIGGKIHTARSRDDLHSTKLRMNIRDSFLNILPSFIKLRKNLITLARQHSKTVITGYTHLKPAQPISLGFYFLAVAEALERDFSRFNLFYNHLNYSTLGACAFSGTNFDIDRGYTSKLLGFYGFIENAFDAISTRDFILELFSNFTIMSSTINQLAHDLYYWSTDEFGYIEMDISICSISSIMPKKRNPTVLEVIKAKSSHQLAAFVDGVSSMRGVSFSHNRDVSSESIHLLWDSFEEMEAVLDLTNEVLINIHINERNLKQRADSNFSTFTNLADELVRTEGISFHVAHEITKHIALDCANNCRTARDITPEQLDVAGKIYVGRSFGWDKKRLQLVLDSLGSIQKLQGIGFPSPNQCVSMATKMEKCIERHAKRLDQSIIEQREADERLKSEIKKVFN